MSKIPAQGDVDVSKTSLWYIVSINSPDILLYPLRSCMRKAYFPQLINFVLKTHTQTNSLRENICKVSNNAMSTAVLPSFSKHDKKAKLNSFLAKYRNTVITWILGWHSLMESFLVYPLLLSIHNFSNQLQNH